MSARIQFYELVIPHGQQPLRMALLHPSVAQSHSVRSVVPPIIYLEDQSRGTTGGSDPQFPQEPVKKYPPVNLKYPRYAEEVILMDKPTR